MTFNAKNLSYDRNEPTFLRRLRVEHGDGEPARHECPLARPRKHKTSDDDDDEPTYVDGNSQNTISKIDYDTLMNPKKLEKEETSASSSRRSQSLQMEDHATIGNDHLDEIPPSQLKASIGGNPKKRLAKVIGDDGKSAHSSPNGIPPALDSGSISKSKKKEKKAKKIKLSFEEGDEK